MRKEIWKYVLKVEDNQTIMMPDDSVILSVGLQSAGTRGMYDLGDICLWAIGDITNVKVARYIQIIGTGNPVPNDEEYDRRFIGTVQQGRFVWHIFEKIDLPYMGDANDE